jgi:DNA polymerase
MRNEFRKIVKLTLDYLKVQKEAGILEVFVPLKKKKSRLKELALLREKVKGCKRCGLHLARKNIVFGDGNPDAKLVFVGEAPGQEEDEQGLPFVGAAGQLLTKIIEAIGLVRQEVYICNLLRCRPPMNRNPLPEEINSCRPYLDSQLKIIQPKVICALGKFAAQTLLNTQLPILKLRGIPYDYGGSKLIATLHPGYLLRNPAGKRLVWNDMKKVRELLRDD